MKQHTYQTTVEWVGNLGAGTSSYIAYERDFIASALNKPNILGSADPAFRGDKTRWNPEDSYWHLFLPVINYGIYIFVQLITLLCKNTVMKQ